MNKMGILQLISSESFITYNKTLAKKLGIYETILLGELCSISSLFKSDTFFFTREKIENDTCLSEYQIKQATEHLKSLGVITTERKGIPCKLYYTLHEDVIVSLVQDSKTSYKNTDDPVSENLPNCSNKNSPTISNNTNNNTSSNNTNSSAQSKDCEKDEKKSTLTSQYKEIEKEYFDVWDKLYSEHKVATEKPIIDYRIIRSREKSLLSGGLTKNQLKSAIDAAVSDSFVMSGGFSLSVILSGTVINRLINGSKPSSDNDSVFGNNNPFELSDRHNRCASIDRSQEPGYWEDVMSMSFEERLKKAESSDNYFKGA